MLPTLTARCDRRGHGAWRAVLALVAGLLAPSLAAAAGPGAYSAPRFDVNVRVLAGGNLDVTESIAFDFQSGTFQKVWREIPSSRTDGIEIDRGAAAVKSRSIVYAIALGLAHQWSRYLKRHPDAAPAWFVAAANEDAGGAFAAFVGSSAAGTSAAGSGAGAAGGGSSGAG